MMTTETSEYWAASLTRLQGAIGGMLMMLFIGLSFDLSVICLLFLIEIGAAAVSAMVLKGAEVHPPPPTLKML